MSAVSLQNVTVLYNCLPALWNINTQIPEGTLIAVAGPNGAGKTTLIKTIVGLIKPLAGTIKIFGKPYEQNKNVIAYIPQRSTIDWDFPVTVFDVVMMGRYQSLGWFKNPGKNDYDMVYKALEDVNLLNYIQQPIGELSGGQQQRVFIARALAQDASLYIMDEPFTGVDFATEQAISKILKRLRDNGKTIMVVHHDLHTIRSYFDWVLMLNVEQIACGPVEEVMTSRYVKAAFGNTKSYSFQPTV